MAAGQHNLRMHALETNRFGRWKWKLNQGQPCSPLHRAQQQLPRRLQRRCGALKDPSGDSATTEPRNTSPSRKPGSGPNPRPNPQPPNAPNNGDDGGLPTRVRYWILLLAEYGGIYGTAAVLIAALTHVDAFGGLHWDPSHVVLGLGLMAPAMAFDALVGLPDWGTRREDAAAVVRLFVDPDLLRQGGEGEKGSEGGSGGGGAQPVPGSSAAAAELRRQREHHHHHDDGAATTTATAATAIATTSSDGTSAEEPDRVTSTRASTSSDAGGGAADVVGGGGGGGGEGVSIFSNGGGRVDGGGGPSGGEPGSTAVRRQVLAPAASSAASSSSRPDSTAEDSTAAAGGAVGGRAVSSTSGGSEGGGGGGAPGSLWAAAQRLRMALELMQESSIRNNPGARLTPLQEVAVVLVAVTADEMLYRAVLLTLFGLWLRDRAYEAGAEEVLSLPLPLLPGGAAEVDTAAAAQWAALGVGVAAGAAVFAAKAWQETRVAERLRAMQEAQAEEEAKALRKQRLLGQHLTEQQLREERHKQARLQAAQASLVASIGLQGALVWALEGGREVYQLAAVGSSFLLTGNLAAPLAGSLAAQLLVCAYQRLGLRRVVQRRAKSVEARRRAAREQRGGVETAEAIKAAEAGAEPAAAAEGGAEVSGAEEAGAAGSGAAAPAPAPSHEQQQQQ